MTRMLEAQNGQITEEIRAAAKLENMDAEQFREKVAQGHITIVRNSKRSITPLIIGEGTSIKVNANIGTSSSQEDLSQELEKVRLCEKYGAHALMDLSTSGDLAAIRKKIMDTTSLALGTVPLYEMAFRAQEKKKSVLDLTADEMFAVIEDHCAQGVDFLTLHCGVTKQTVQRFKEVKRLGGATSRGGTIIMEWIHHNKEESPLYAQYDRLLDILAKYDVAISLGDAFRPGATSDATDRAQIEELSILGELVDRARKRGVGSFVEGPGHVPLNQIVTNIQIQKRLCRNAPFYVLGPLTTDTSLGHDHISGAIGGALAGMAGVDFLCYVTPAEHLRLPSLDDVKEGVIASKIAAQSADLAKGVPAAIERDDAMTRAKIAFDWETIYKLSVDPEKARAYRESLPPSMKAEECCSMCGEFCAVKRSNEVLK
ncbi:phosphomethylpyrimidine synthase ThiC [Chitinivibrio alkaliphilus]|uniref:Phosphomethylpyrimidine synthase n=1 Tax=Chitinivibrio alkaliphilus ACht1 TaxID=1313304 RepID=U7D877_9BACT|nr:phosphomethylpyrimidine synthase ThiC [Chitinivibrio alkaliphilus]ERP39160.1 thiamine biosynthesis protein ThiC [Chitinivibrio alkaliphilus ACht1]